MREPLPLATIHEAVLEFLRGRDDVVVFGATAVNAYVDEPRMTQDIDLMSTRAIGLAEELREYLSERFHIAVRVRTVRGGQGLSAISNAKDRQSSFGRRTPGGFLATIANNRRHPRSGPGPTYCAEDYFVSFSSRTAERLF